MSSNDCEVVANRKINVTAIVLAIYGLSKYIDVIVFQVQNIIIFQVHTILENLFSLYDPVKGTFMRLRDAREGMIQHHFKYLKYNIFLEVFLFIMDIQLFGLYLFSAILVITAMMQISQRFTVAVNITERLIKEQASKKYFKAFDVLDNCFRQKVRYYGLPRETIIDV